MANIFLPSRQISRTSPAIRCLKCTSSMSFSRYFASAVEPTERAPATPPPAQSFSPIDTGFAHPDLKKDDEVFAMRTYKPRTPGLRHLKRAINDHLWKGRPFHPLTIAKKGQALGGRNWTGRITVRHRGGGHKRRIRTVDFMRMAPGKHTVDRIEHDPGRTAHIALLTENATGRKTYIVAAEGMRAGDVVESYRAGIPKALLDSMGGVIDPGVLAARTAWRGNCLPLHMVPVGTLIYNVGSAKNRGAVFCRSAGTYAIVISKEEEATEVEEGQESSKPTVANPKWVNIRMQSGEIRRVSREACATIGVASNVNKQHEQYGKAGRKRWLGIRPTVRGLAMNAVDHPHGGGRGKNKSRRHPTSPWGTLAKSGFKTRNKRKPNKWTVVERPRGKNKETQSQ